MKSNEINDFPLEKNYEIYPKKIKKEIENPKNINIDNIYYSIIDPYNQIRTNNLGASKSYRNNNDKYILKNNSSNSYRNRNINSYSPHNIKNIEYKINYDLPHSQIKYENKEKKQFFYKIQSKNIINHDKSENNMMEERNKFNSLDFNFKIENNVNNKLLNSKNKIEPKILNIDNNYKYNINNKTYDYIINQNDLFKENGSPENINKSKILFEKIHNLISNKDNYLKKNSKYHYKLIENENIKYKNNQLINNGIENKNYKFNKNIINIGIKMQSKVLNNFKKLLTELIYEKHKKNYESMPEDLIRIEEDYNNNAVKSSKIIEDNNKGSIKYEINNNNFFINKTDYKNNVNNSNFNKIIFNNNKKSSTSINSTRSNTENSINNFKKKINNINFNNQINEIYNGYIKNNNLQNDEDEEELYYECDNNNDINYDNYINYFFDTETIKEVNEDMEDSSSENNIITKKNNLNKNNKDNNKVKYIKKSKSKKNNNNFLKLKKLEQQIFNSNKNKTILERINNKIINYNKKNKNNIINKNLYHKIIPRKRNKSNRNEYKKSKTVNKKPNNIYNRIKHEFNDFKHIHFLSNSLKSYTNLISRDINSIKSPLDLGLKICRNGKSTKNTNIIKLMVELERKKTPTKFYYSKILNK